MTLQISQRVLDLGGEGPAGPGGAVCTHRRHCRGEHRPGAVRVPEAPGGRGYFAGTTGYGYDDLGRDQLDQIYADLFGTEAALVRIQFVNGTHAITCALFGALKAGMCSCPRWGPL